MPIRPPIEEQLTIAPLPCSRIWRSSYFMQFQTPRRLIAYTRSNSSPLASAVSTAGLHTGIVVRRIQATEGGYGLLNHRYYLSLVGDIAADRDRLMASGDQFLYCGANRVLMDIRQRDSRSRLREGSGCRQTDARGSSSN